MRFISVTFSTVITLLRRYYRTYIHSPALDRCIYAVLDLLTDLLARVKGFSFPKNYIRRWKLNMLWGLYEAETYALFRKILRPEMVVVDIGAHIGYFTRLFARCVGPHGRVYAFEADPVNFALLTHNTKGLQTVRLCELAVTDKKGMVDFYHYDDKSGAHSTLPNVPLNYTKRKLAVPATDLDSWLTENGVTGVEVIKMDIEGGESAALRGMKATLESARVLVTECAPAWIEAAGGSTLSFLKTIESHGFEIFAVTQRGLIRLSPVHDGCFASLLPKPKDGSHQSEFINLYCVKDPDLH